MEPTTGVDRTHPATRTSPPSRTPATPPRGFDKLFRSAMIVIPIGVFGNVLFSLWRTDRSLLASLADLPRGYLVLALLLGVVPWFANALRLLIWTRFLGHGVSFRDAFRITLATDLGSAVSPTAVGGGFFKWGMLVQKGVSPGAAVSLATLTPIEDGLFFLIAIPIGIYLTASWGNPVFAEAAGQLRESAPALFLVAGGIALFSWLALRWVLGGRFGRRTQRKGLRLAGRTKRRLRGSWIDAREVFRLIRSNGKARFALSMSLTSVQWAARYSIVSALVAFLGAPVHPVLFGILQWVVFTLAAFVPTPGGAGGAEAAFFVVYSPFIPAAILPLTTAAWRFFTFYVHLLLAALLYMVIRDRQAGR